MSDIFDQVALTPPAVNSPTPKGDIFDQIAPAANPVPFLNRTGHKPSAEEIQSVHNSVNRSEIGAKILDFLGGLGEPGGAVEGLTASGLMNMPSRLATGLGAASTGNFTQPVPLNDLVQPNQALIHQVPNPTGTGVISGIGRVGAGVLNTLQTPEAVVTLPALGESLLARALMASQIGSQIPDQVASSATTLGDINSTTADKTEATLNPIVSAATIAALNHTKPTPPSGITTGMVPGMRLADIDSANGVIPESRQIARQPVRFQANGGDVIDLKSAQKDLQDGLTKNQVLPTDVKPTPSELDPAILAAVQEAGFNVTPKGGEVKGVAKTSDIISPQAELPLQRDATEHMDYSPEDLVKYGELKKGTIPTKAEDLNDPNFQKNWQEFEALRNKYNGNPPKQLQKLEEPQLTQPNEIQAQTEDANVQKAQAPSEDVQTIEKGDVKKVTGGIGAGLKSAVEKNVNNEGGSVVVPSKDELVYAGRDFVTQAEKMLRDPKAIGFAQGASVDSQQLKNRLKNKLGENSQEWNMLKDSGVEDYLKEGKKTPSEVAQWVADNAHKVEVHDYGMDGKSSPEKTEYQALHHELDTLHYYSSEDGQLSRRGTSYTLDRDNPNIPKRVLEIANRLDELRGKVVNDSNVRATGAYEGVSPFDTHSPMPEWTKSKSKRNVQRVDVVVPTKVGENREAKVIKNDDGTYSVTMFGRPWEGGTKYTTEQKALESIPLKATWSPDNLHENLPNTLGWAMIQYKDVPKIRDGRKLPLFYTKQGEPIGKAYGMDSHGNLLGEMNIDNQSDEAFNNFAYVDSSGLKNGKLLIAANAIYGTDLAKKVAQKAANDYGVDVTLHLSEDASKPDVVLKYQPNKIAVIAEAQSRWGQEVRNEIQSLKAKGELPSTIEQMQRNKHTKIADHPLLKDYNRLILKAAIAQARKEGATHIVVSDAESAMMTEGHDANIDPIRLVFPVEHQAIERAKGLEEDGYKNVKIEQDKKSGDWVVTEIPEISQEPGMRLNYDTILPKIAEDLTGYKGERVELGEHKNAFLAGALDERGNEFDYHEAVDAGLSPDEIARLEEQSHTRTDLQRKNLIFKNPDGSFKTSASGLMYPIDKIGKRLESGEPMTLTGKLYGGLPFLDIGDKSPLDVARDIKKIAEPVIDTVAKSLAAGDVRKTMAQKFDAIRGVSQSVANQLSNNIRGNLQRSFGKDVGIASDALSLVRESQEVKDHLLGQLTEAQKGALDSLPKWKKRWMDAAEFAVKNWEKLTPISEQYKKLTDDVLARLQDVDKPVEGRSGYVRHLPEDGESSNGFRHAREFPTFFDRIKAGSDPRTINSVDLLKSTLYDSQRLYIQSEAFNKWMSNIKDPKSGKPLAITPKQYEVVKRGEDMQTDVRPPAGYVEKSIGGQRVAVLEDYANLMDRLTNLSILGKSAKGRLLQSYAGLAKHVEFAVDIVHLARIARREVFGKMGQGAMPLPSWKKGILTLDYTPSELAAKVKAGEIDEKQLPQLLENRSINNKLIEGGFNVGHYADAIRESWLEKLPVSGQVQKFIFNTFTRGAMAEVGPITYKTYKAQYPKLSEAQLVSKTVKDLNFTFGNMGKQGWIKSATSQDMLRLFIAAPQWTEATPRYEGQAIGGTAYGTLSAAKNTVTKGPSAVVKDPSLRPFNLQSRTIGSMILGYLIANQVINTVTMGHSTFQNEEGHKLDAYIPLPGGGGFWVGPEAAAMETVHRIEQVINKSDTFLEGARKYAGPKLSVLGQDLAQAATGHKFGLTGPIVPKADQLKSVATGLIPKPIIANALNKDETVPQLLRSSGLEGDLAPSDRAKMFQLARKWQRDNKIVQPEGDFAISQYADLNDALRNNKMSEAKTAYETLKNKLGSDKLIQRYYKNYPDRGFTNSEDQEKKFKETLTPEQLVTYEKATASNETVKQKFYEMLGEEPPLSAHEDRQKVEDKKIITGKASKGKRFNMFQ